MNASKCFLPTTPQLLARNGFPTTKLPRGNPNRIPCTTPTASLGVTYRSLSGVDPRKCRRGFSSQTSTVTSQVAARASPDLAPLWRVSESAPSTSDVLVSALFVLATLALLVLTAGVGYLSFTSWFDDRQEREDRESFGSRDKYDDEMNKFRNAGAKKTTKEKQPVRRSTPKGFGKE